MSVQDLGRRTEATRTINILMVTSPGCHLCDDALRLFDEVGKATPLRVRTVPLASDEGRALLVRHRVPFPPIVLINGAFFGYGRISRRKLEHHLPSRAISASEV